MTDFIRPAKTVEVQCRECTWWFWVSALDDRLPCGPFVCFSCMGLEGPGVSGHPKSETGKVGVQ